VYDAECERDDRHGTCRRTHARRLCVLGQAVCVGANVSGAESNCVVSNHIVRTKPPGTRARQTRTTRQPCVERKDAYTTINKYNPVRSISTRALFMSAWLVGVGWFDRWV
jgi:hypothetical protein